MSVTDNKSFWIYFLATNFPNAFDEDSDTDLNDFITDEYEFDEDFINEFTQYSEDVFYTNDGYVDSPNTIEIIDCRFKIEFHPGDTVYFLDGVQIGCTGGHFILKTVSTQTFRNLIDSIEDARIPLLILPMLSADTEQDVIYIQKIIKSGLNAVGIKPEHINKITDMIISGLS